MACSIDIWLGFCPPPSSTLRDLALRDNPSAVKITVKIESAYRIAPCYIALVIIGVGRLLVALSGSFHT